MKMFARYYHIIVMAWAVSLIILGVFGLYVSVANEQRILSNETKIDRNYHMAQNFMSRTGDRWDYFHQLNPGLIVPKVEEPNNKAHLTPEEMERSDALP